MPLLRFQANVYALPDTAMPGPARSLRGRDYATLVGDGGGPPLFTSPLPSSFEEIQRRLMELPRCDCEPDGFFLVTGHEDRVFWRLNGHMHEYDGRMHRVELNGECPPSSLDGLLAILGGGSTPLAFELVQEGVTLREDDFRRLAASPE